MFKEAKLSYDSWSHKESDTTEWLNWTELKLNYDENAMMELAYLWLQQDFLPSDFCKFFLFSFWLEPTP